ncbi:B3/B4 domain-containing protein [Rhizohabitans arisaemae]|uniref:B3/B4 domain-containing protein n=1 Tax=Rhizohabitans arisaemae TaxID=2720610 RepID=UPI0024B1C06D|nr:phenylalanine--tRNA ligase beta subunit-related protein [Rhizohabitans arisaemae]
MYFQHSRNVWEEHPDLVAGAVAATGITPEASIGAALTRFGELARARLAAGPEAGFPEIQAWRRAFARMGLRPTQYRCASESLLRRFRKEGELPRIHPLVDLCNAISLAFAIPVAALDTEKISEGLEVRHADGDERYVTFGGETENPDRGEVTFVDAAGRAHARRWTNRQSGHSAVQDATTSVLIVVEAMHESAGADVPGLLATVADELAVHWPVTPRTATVTASSPRLDFTG